MGEGPEGLEVATIDDAAVEAEKMLVIALREYVIVVLACYLDGSGIGVL